jgi:AcrR family transcriptional regulator
MTNGGNMAKEKKAVEKAVNTRTSARRRMLQDFMKNEIFNAVVDAVEKHQWAIISMDEIASEIGGSKGTIYYYFKSKNDLMVAMWLHLHRQMTEVLLPIYQDTALDAEAKMTKYIHTFVKLYCGYWRLTRAIWTNSLFIIKWDEGTGKELLKERRVVIKAIMRMIANLNPKQKIKAEVLDIKARAVLHSLEAISIWYREPFHMTIDEVADLMTGMIMNGIRGKR